LEKYFFNQYKTKQEKLFFYSSNMSLVVAIVEKHRKSPALHLGSTIALLIHHQSFWLGQRFSNHL